MEVNININASESLLKALDMLVEAVNGLASTEVSIQKQLEAVIPEQKAEPVAPIGVAPHPVERQPVTPVVPKLDVPEPQAVPTPVTAPAPQQIQVSQVSYTTEQLALAASQLMDAGKRDALCALLSKFGVQALTALPQEQYGAFATELRQMGASI